MTIADLDQEQVSEHNLSLEPLYFNLTHPVQDVLKQRFDCIIDSSVTDVFMQLTCGSVPSVSEAKTVHEKLLSMLKPDGIMVVFSMNNKPWENIYRGSTLNRQHMRIRPTFHITTKRGRVTKKTGEDVLVLVASTRDLTGLSNIQSNEYATFAEWSPHLPEDWSSQRD